MKKTHPNEFNYSYTVPFGFEGTVEVYLKKYHDYSSRVITAIKKEGKLTLNGADVYFKAPARSGDRIEIIMGGAYPDCEPENLPLDILYEDDELIVLNKAAHMVVHPTKSHQNDTLANAIYYHWQNIGFVGKLHFVNRIDMDTSGVVVAAKNKYAHHFIQQQSLSGSIEKNYLAIVSGAPEPPEGIIDAPIGREEENSIFRIVRPDGEPSRTRYATLERFGSHSLLGLTLETGRTHQIRVHLKYLGTPIIGDSLYYPEPNDLMQRCALHAAHMSFVHPRSGDIVSFDAPLPEDFALALQKLRSISI